ncbi:MAG: hypothetical protein ABSH50_15075 [Bryobacteraceae bacterium]|jgi:hypothetical protein
MKRGITRRQLTGAILATAAAAQTPPSAQPNPQSEIDAARRQNQRTGEALAKADIPMATEPAFHFTT